MASLVKGQPRSLQLWGGMLSLSATEKMRECPLNEASSLVCIDNRGDAEGAQKMERIR